MAGALVGHGDHPRVDVEASDDTVSVMLATEVTQPSPGL